ncbi:MAG: OmpA family protein [Acidobacteriota bacterium]|nr:OmpA family protein [Acidobacteriota bacterium]
MQKSWLVSLVFISLVGTVACHKAVPVAARPPQPVPVAAAPQTTAAPPSSGALASQGRPAVQGSPSRGITAEDREELKGRLAHLEDALFDYDKSSIRADAASALQEDVSVIRGILAKDPNEKLRIEGHCDERGSEEYNLALGDKRADAVREFFVTMGVPQAQLTVISYGKEKPVCAEQSEDCWQKNRRAHIVAQNN